jgi:hypothetical protein
VGLIFPSSNFALYQKVGRVHAAQEGSEDVNKPGEGVSMFHRILFAISGAGLSIALNFGAFAQHSPTLSDADYVKQALAAGPEAVANGAAVVRPEHDGTMRALRQGTNGFTCVIMGTDRMCADKNSMEFIHAMMSHQPPPNQIGIAYMLGGDTGPSGETGGASNIDPSATAKTADNHWVVTGPHIMIFGPPSKALGYTEVADPDPTRPYMMWANTPYEHAMVPVK